jgi:NhaP-type Na+/H+ or K+/H+ antiporter
VDAAVLAAIALGILLFGAVSARAERSVVTPPMAFTAFGLLLASTGVAPLEADHAAIELLAELTLALVLFVDASRIELRLLRREGGLPLRMLVAGMPLTIAAGAVVAMALFPALGPAPAFLLAAILAPTDAALGQAVVASPEVPVRIRQALNVESGLNDGIALPVVLVLASFASARGAEQPLGQWAAFAAAQVGIAPFFGAAVGWFGARALSRAASAGWVTAPFERLTVIGLALLAFAGAEQIGTNGFIAAFCAGVATGNGARDICTCLWEFGEAEGQLLTLLVFFTFGAVMVPAALPHLDAPALAFALLALTALRMLPVALSLAGTGLRPVSAAFLGWFGPRGLASILFAILIVERGDVPQAARIESVVVLTVLLSVLLHGASAHLGAVAYARRLETLRRPEREHEAVSEMPLRAGRPLTPR